MDERGLLAHEEGVMEFVYLSVKTTGTFKP